MARHIGSPCNPYGVHLETPGSAPARPMSPSVIGGKGNPGDSAYQIAVKHGFTGTEEQWLESLKGGAKYENIQPLFYEWGQHHQGEDVLAFIRTLTNTGYFAFSDGFGDIYIRLTEATSGTFHSFYCEFDRYAANSLTIDRRVYSGDSIATLARDEEEESAAKKWVSDIRIFTTTLKHDEWQEVDGAENLFTQTVSVPQLSDVGTHESVIQLCPAPSAIAAWTSYKMFCVSASPGSMVFTAETRPAENENITINCTLIVNKRSLSGSIIIQQMCGNGGSGRDPQEIGYIETINGIRAGADRNITLKAENVGAALAALNLRTVTRAYNRYMATEGHEDITPYQFLLSRGKGNYFLRASDGVHFIACVDVVANFLVRLYLHIPAVTEGDGDKIEGGIYIENTKIVDFSSDEDMQNLLISLGESPITTQAYVRDLLASYVTSETLSNLLKGKVTPTGAHNIAKYEINRMLPLTAVGSTYLEKVKENGKTMIKIVFGCQDWLYNNWNTFESVKLQLLICHRRHGLKYRWRHPLNWDEESADPESNRYGYGSIVGMERDPQHYPGEEFPAVPRWMQHGGYMETSITLKREDAKRGFYMIDPSLYFLPMLKPADCSKAFGSNNLEFMGCQPRSNTARRHLPAMVTWSVEVDGYPLGKPMNTLRVGCFRLADRTRIVNNYYAQPGRAYVSGLYLKID